MSISGGTEALEHRDRAYVIDPEKTLKNLGKKDREELDTRTWQDWDDAQRARRIREDRITTDLRIYMRQSRDVAAAQAERDGWSNMEVPMCFWLTETLLARNGVTPPAVVMRARSPQAQPWALARELRMRHYMDVGNWRRASVITGKRQLIFGDGPEKVIWDPHRGGPVRVPIPWHDFWLSPECSDYRDAEYYCYVTYWRPSALKRVLARQNHERKSLGLEPFWIGYEEAIDKGITNREDIDKTYQERLDITRTQVPDPRDRRTQMVPLCEIWYDDGSYITSVIGRSASTVIRAQKSPFHWPGRDERPLRPFTIYQYVPNVAGGPYSVSLPQIVGDHQIELSTLRNMFADSLAANIAAPLAYMDDIDEADIRDAFSAPGKMFPVPHGQYSSVSDAIERLAPGYVAQDMGGLYDQIRDEANMAVGVFDLGQAGQSTSGSPTSTATGASIVQGEQNKRIQLLMWMSEEAAGPLGTAGHMDAMDRQFGKPMLVDVDPGFDPDGADGITPVDSSDMPTWFDRVMGRKKNPYARGKALVANGAPPDAAFEVAVDSGAPNRADQSEAANRTLIAADIMAANPMMAPNIDWVKMTRTVLDSLGLPAEQLMTGPNATPLGMAPPGGVPAQQPPGAPGGMPANGNGDAALAGVGPPEEAF